MKYKFLTGLILLAALLGCRRSAPPVSEPSGAIVVADRLSNQRVNAFAEDADGHIWIATSRGLNRYSVHEYHQYFSADDTLGLPDNQVNDVFRSSNGTIWAATNSGVARLTSEGQFRYVPAPGRPNANHLWETRDGKLLMSNSASLFQYDADEDRFRPVVRDFNAFSHPYAVQEGNFLWVTANGGTVLNCYNTEDFSLTASYPTSHIVYHLCDAGNGELWMSGMGRMSIFDTRTRTWKELPEAIRNEPRLMQGDVDIIYNVDDRSILLNVIGKGMFHYYRTTERVLFQDDAGFPFELPDSEIRTIFRDSEHNLWFGTTDQGYTVSYLYRNQFNSNKFLTSAFAGKTVVSLCLDQEQRLWIATLRDGLWLYDLRTKDLRNVNEDSLIPNTSVGYNRCSKVFCDSGGDLWLFFLEKYWVVRCRY
jgi:ligand-binding sensor domain-containing protein